LKIELVKKFSGLSKPLAMSNFLTEKERALVAKTPQKSFR
jgi:hypothetical protein